MNRLVLTFCIASAVTPALAIERYDIGARTCGAVQELVRRDGAAILRYRSERNPSLTLYDRYVRNGRFCSTGEFASPAYVPTSDDRDCPVRLCKQRSHDSLF